MNIFTPYDLRRIMAFATTGGLAGLGAGQLMSLLSKWRDASQDAESGTDDDNTLYVRTRPQAGSFKAAADDVSGKGTPWGTGAAVTGGALTFLGALALSRSVMQKLRRKELQQRLDREQNAVVDTMEAKSATAGGRSPALTNKALVTGAPMALLMMLGLGSGALSYKILDRAFPPVKKDPTADGPPRVVFKEGSVSGINPNALLALCVLASGMSKEAGVDSGLSDLLAAMAHGRCAEMEDALLKEGAEAMFGRIGGLAEIELPELLVRLGVCRLGKSAALLPAAAVLAAAEIMDLVPHVAQYGAKLAASSPEFADDMEVFLAGCRELEFSQGGEKAAAWEPVRDGDVTAGLDKAIGAPAANPRDKGAQWLDMLATAGESGDTGPGKLVRLAGRARRSRDF